MPFDYDKYQERCNGMSAEELQKEWENYTRQMSAGATSTATAVLLMPLTAGISAVGLGISAPRIHNARKKREIIEAGLRAKGTTHHTRTGDVLAPMAVSGIIGGLTLGLAPPGASDFAAVAAGRAVELAAANTALTATEAVVVDNARKKKASDANLQSQLSPEQSEKYGLMAIPFLMEQSVLAFEQPLHQQTYQPQDGVETSATFVQDSQTTSGAVNTQSTNIQNQQDPSLSQSLSSRSIQGSGDLQTTDIKAPPTCSDATLSASIPSQNLDGVSDLLVVEEEHMFKLHALALTMEKREAGSQSLDPDPSRLQSQQAPQGNAEQDQQPQFITASQMQPLENVDENQAHPDDTSRDATNHPHAQELRPAIPSRQGPHSSTLPARLESPQAGFPTNQDAQNPCYPPQALPPYQPQYFPPTHQVVEPQQYYPSPPPPQQRQDSGYGSMYSAPSINNAPPQTYCAPSTVPSINSTPPQTYYPPPTAPSVNSTLPQTYYPSPTASSIGGAPSQAYYPPPTAFSINSAPPQTYYPSPSFVSRHSSIPESYQNPSIARKPVPYHPGDPNHQQGSMNQGHHGSESSLYPMTPPPPYYPPPPGTGMVSAPVTMGKENDYFNHAAVPPQPVANMNSSPYNPLTPLLQQPQKLVDEMNKGWQWARAAALPTKTPVDSKKFVEPNYGPPPGVPTAWKG